MRYVSIVATLSGAPDDALVAAKACELAVRHRATATMVIAVPISAPVAAPLGVGAGVMSPVAWQAIEESRGNLVRAVRATVTAEARRRDLACGPAGQAPCVRLAPDAITPWLGLQRELPLADLVVVGRSSVAGGGVWAGTFSDILLTARAPVLVVGDDNIPLAGEVAAIAWDGSAEAGRAVRAATPLLGAARSVTILQDVDELDVAAGEAADPARLIDYLGAHGVLAVSVSAVAGGRAGPALIAAARQAGAGLLVSGAFGHTRVREAVFGGATRAFLDARGGPNLLLCH